MVVEVVQWQVHLCTVFLLALSAHEQKKAAKDREPAAWSSCCQGHGGRLHAVHGWEAGCCPWCSCWPNQCKEEQDAVVGC